MRALLIEWKSTGERAGNINPKDPKLQCYGWQNMDVTPMLELRIVEDDRDLSYLKNTNGVIIIEGKTAINIAIEENFPTKYSIEDKLLYEEHVKQEINNDHIVIANLPDNTLERLKKLKHKFRIKGIKEKKPEKV